MSARILKFVPLAEYERLLFEELNISASNTDSTVMTSHEQMRALYEKSLEALWHMTVFYKTTGKWNETTENLMRRMVTHATRICAELSGVRQYGEATAESPEAGNPNGTLGAVGSSD